MPCDPAGERIPLPSDGGVCGDGIRGQRCFLSRVFGCGNDSEQVICEAPEVCEANDLNGATCETVGLSGSGLRCAGCQGFDDSACDACPRRPGVQCQPLGVLGGASLHAFTVAPGGSVGLLAIDDQGRVKLHVAERGRVVKTMAPRPGHDPRHLVAVAKDRFVYLVESYVAGTTRSEAVLAVPFSARGGVGQPIEIVRLPDVRVQAATVTDGVPLVLTFQAGPHRVLDVHALSASGAPMPLPENRAMIVAARFTPEFAILRRGDQTLQVTRPNNLGACATEAGLRTGDGPLVRAPTSTAGTVVAVPDGSSCRVTWTVPDGTVTVLGGGPPPMQGVTDWKREGSMWLGLRQGFLLTVDPLEYR